MSKMSKERPFKLRSLKATFGASRTNDDVHTSISLCPLMLAVLDTPHMQRLRGLRQLGVSEMTYIPTTHCRFEHSLGVAALAENILREIKKKQPNLNITEKDIICVKIAGLLHDIGHGPFSHLYDGLFRKSLKKAEMRGEWLGQKFDVGLYDGLPEVKDGWEHEDGSLMMIDDLLKSLGMEIDEQNLDAPLKQIGDGIRAESFGLVGEGCDDRCEFYDGSSPLPLENVLTSRDWIFIKECIVGGPLPQKGCTVDSTKKSSETLDFVGRPSIHKEYLYDIVSNRHSGLDVDKMDYLARDDRRAFGLSGFIDPMLIENAHVAWGKCGRPEKCFRCKHKHRAQLKVSTDKFDGMHLMVCYPEKMVQNAMNFFKQRFRNHQKLYTHQTTNAAGYMICDILLLADPFIRLSTMNEGEDGLGKNPSSQQDEMRLPISRANGNAQSYLKLRDSIIDIIAATEDSNLRPARVLINRYRSHNLYKKVAEQSISSDRGNSNFAWQQKIWDMDEETIASNIFKCGQLRNTSILFSIDDIIVEKRQIHHGMGVENPVSSMRFIPKIQLSKLRNEPENLPIAEKVEESEYECCIPRAFLQRTLRIYCRKVDRDVCDFLTTCYHQFITQVQKRDGIPRPRMDDNIKNRYAFPPNILSQSPPRYSNESFAVSQSSFHESNGYLPPQKRARKSLFSSLNANLDSP